MAHAPRKPKTPEELTNLAEISASTIQEALAEWATENSPEKLKAKCLRTLDNSREDILRALLGFEKDSWGRNEWRVDHCNGRAGESAAGDYIRRHQQAAIEQWLHSVTLPAIDAGMKKSMQQEAKDVFMRLFRKNLEAKVATYAHEQADIYFNEFIKQQQTVVHEQLKAMNLIAPMFKE